MLIKINLADVSWCKKSNLLCLQDVVLFLYRAFCLNSLEIGEAGVETWKASLKSCVIIVNLSSVNFSTT